MGDRYGASTPRGASLGCFYCPVRLRSLLLAQLWKPRCSGNLTLSSSRGNQDRAESRGAAPSGLPGSQWPGGHDLAPMCLG